MHEKLSIDEPEELIDDTIGCLSREDTSLKEWPKDAMSIDDIAISLSGIRPLSNDVQLYDVYPSRFNIGSLPVEGTRGDMRQVFAQYEAFLGK